MTDLGLTEAPPLYSLAEWGANVTDIIFLSVASVAFLVALFQGARSGGKCDYLTTTLLPEIIYTPLGNLPLDI